MNSPPPIPPQDYVAKANNINHTMNTIILNEENNADIEKAAEIIKNGGLVAFPTETVYGLGADATNAEACKNIFSAKGRPQDNPLIVHLAYVSDVDSFAYTNELFKKIAAEFMPGPLTVILPKKDIIPDTVTAGLDSVAIRVPMNPTAHKLIKLSGKPIAAPSANLSGKPSPTTASHVLNDLTGRVDAILCGTDAEVGVESTVIKLTGENSLVICRPGGITREMLEAICDNVTIDPAVLSKFEGKPISPGMKYRHYAPSAPVTVLIGTEQMIIDYIIDKNNFGLLVYNDDYQLLQYNNAVSFGKSDDLEAQAHLLFDRLRSFDDNKAIKQIFARMPSQEGIGLAVYNRLIKAAGFSIIDLRNR